MMLVALVVLGACASPGDRAARGELSRRQQLVADSLQRYLRPGADPVQLARNVVGTTTPDSGPGEFDVAVEPLGWDDSRIDLRFTVHTDGYSSGTVFGTSYGPGSAQECVRFTLDFHIPSRSLDCDDHLVVSLPSAAPVAGLTSGPLLEAITADTFDQAVGAAWKVYEPSGLVVQADIVGGTWAIVVIRSPPDYDCIAAVRRAGRKAQIADIPRATRQPGEGGCSPANAVHPVRTH